MASVIVVAILFAVVSVLFSAGIVGTGIFLLVCAVAVTVAIGATLADSLRESDRCAAPSGA